MKDNEMLEIGAFKGILYFKSDVTRTKYQKCERTGDEQVRHSSINSAFIYAD